jgi:hypothetical protein
VISVKHKFLREEDHLRPHWKLLVAYLDLTLKIEPADVLAIQKVAELFLERSLPIPKWLETRYLVCVYFYIHLISYLFRRSILATSTIN